MDFKTGAHELALALAIQTRLAEPQAVNSRPVVEFWPIRELERRKNSQIFTSMIYKTPDTNVVLLKCFLWHVA